MNSDLRTRVLSGAVMTVLLALFYALGGWFLVGASSVIAFLMMLDVSGALKSGGLAVSRPVLLVAAALLLPALYFFQTAGLLMLVMLAFTALVCVTIFSRTPDFKALFAGVMTLVYPLFPGALLLWLAVYDVKNGTGLGAALILTAVLCACLSDIFAYFGGRLFGKKKLCPAISPKKTVAGSLSAFLGGAIGGAAVSLFGRFWPLFAVSPFTDAQGNSRVLLWVAAGLVCGALSQVGDLAASMLKRACGVKDYGRYIPGHGGIMDRMDSISVCLFAVVLFVQLSGEVIL